MFQKTGQMGFVIVSNGYNRRAENTDTPARRRPRCQGTPAKWTKWTDWTKWTMSQIRSCSAKIFEGYAAASSFVHFSLGGADSSVATSAHAPTFLCFASECGPLVNARSLYARSE